MVDFLAEPADGPALEFAIGTGRVALPLSLQGGATPNEMCRSVRALDL